MKEIFRLSPEAKKRMRDKINLNDEDITFKKGKLIVKPKINIRIEKGCVEVGGDTDKVEIDFRDYDVLDMDAADLDTDSEGKLFINRW